MKATRATMVLVLALAGVSAAQSRTTVVDAPLAVLMPMSDAEAQALQSEFRQALARHDAVLLPTRTSWNKAVAAVGRKDCDVQDACLQQLALASGALYALFASIERNAAGTEVTVTGRVVDREGRPARAQVRLRRAATGTTPALAALQQLVLELELDALPSVLPRRAVETLSAPPVLLISETPPERIAAWVTLGAAVSAVATGVAFGLTAASQLSALPPDGHFTSADQVELQVQGNRSATIAIGTGLGAGALIATSVALFVVSAPINVTAGPTQNGGAVSAWGRF